MKIIIVATICLSLGFVAGFLVSESLDDRDVVDLVSVSSDLPVPGAEKVGELESQGQSIFKTSDIISDTLIATKLGLELSNPVELDENEVQKLSELVDELDGESLQKGLSLFFPESEDLSLIADQKGFAKSLLRELGEDDTEIHSQSQAQLYFSLDNRFPIEPTYTLELDSRQKVYAHIDLLNGLGLGDSQLYIRWKNLQTGQILLFTNKLVDPRSHQHWVSFTPGEDWMAHPYGVTIYRFNSGLDKLVSAQYNAIPKSP